jgi:hypothetical protein
MGVWKSFDDMRFIDSCLNNSVEVAFIEQHSQIKLHLGFSIGQHALGMPGSLV